MLAQLPPEKQDLLTRIVALLSPLPGVQALALGGSYARGTHRAGSDMDVALYYLDSSPFSIEAIRAVAAEISTNGDPVVTDFYTWGPWVNGGAWIKTPAGKVDFLYRSLDQVQRTIIGASQGIVQHDFDQQPAYGFYSVIYLGETRVCVSLYDPQERLARMKEQVAVYPAPLREKIISSALWLAEFSLAHAAAYAANSDVYATAGALTRTASYLTQALFALNEVYFINDKTAIREISGFAQKPAEYGPRLAAILARIGQSSQELTASTRSLHGLWADVVALTGGSYRPAFHLE